MDFILKNKKGLRRLQRAKRAAERQGIDLQLANLPLLPLSIRILGVRIADKTRQCWTRASNSWHRSSLGQDLAIPFAADAKFFVPLGKDNININ
ncbi:hypothetical protein OUZ56_008742 [Daphnia magna]|uniref:Uncharacterized protein n=1 Tax=Daphnia magna TaxID=35525 RepID=A0ABR0ADX9_9CRUS|nr:hypothetical protein OUZ56_008742 [Daphnia magna]